MGAVQACLGARKPQDFGGRRSRALLSLRYRRRSNWTWIAKLFRGPRPRAYPSMLWPNRTFVNTPDTPLGSACAPPLGACFLRLFPAILHWPQRYLTEAVHLRSWESRRSPSVHSQEEACSLAQKNVARGGSHRLPVVPLSSSLLFLHPAVVRLLRWYASASALDPFAVH